MGVRELLEPIQLPKMVSIRQQFVNHEVVNIAEVLQEQLTANVFSSQIKKNMRVAIAVGSRGIAQLPLIVKTIADEIKRCGAQPFIVPAMGSHGGATADGQREVLMGLGITEESTECSIMSSMDTVQLGTSEHGLPVYMDKNAFEADGIVVVNRVKPHTGFSGDHESGLLKMITIGLGKQKGASNCHQAGRPFMSRNITEVAKMAMQKAPILFGVATVENAYDRVMKIVVVPVTRMIDTDKELLITAKANMAKILLQPIDVLIVDQLGKEFSGAGMDPHVTGRASWPYVKVGPEPGRIVVFDLSERSHGNAVGMGMADICTRRFFDKINLDICYTNALTAGGSQGVRIPMIMDSDKLAIQAAVRTCAVHDPDKIRIVRIPNTQHIDDIYISEGMMNDAIQHPNISIIGSMTEFSFDESGNLY